MFCVPKLINTSVTVIFHISKTQLWPKSTYTQEWKQANFKKEKNIFHCSPYLEGGIIISSIKRFKWLIRHLLLLQIENS